MMRPDSSSPRVAIIGGGISGLAAANRLLEIAPQAEIALFEAAGRVGGVLQTARRDGYLIERSADMFTTREPWALDLCRRIGLADELIGTNEAGRKAFVVRGGKLLPVPDGFTLMSPARVWPVLATPLLSWKCKARLGLEYFSAKRPTAKDESLASFVIRHFGREAFDRLIQPLIGGIYTADPERLSMQATLPQFVEMERTHGSLIRAMRANQRRQPTSERASGARYGQFVAPRHGMQQLIETIAARLPEGAIRLNSPVEKIARIESGGWLVEAKGAAPDRYSAVILALPAHACPKLLAPVDAELARLVGSIPHAGCSVVILGYRREQIARPCPGFGVVAPAVENRRIIAASFASLKFPGRAPEDRLLIRVFVGGALQPELARLADSQLEALVRQELAELIGAQGEPEFCEVARWLGIMPQYHVGHLDLVAAIEKRAEALPHFSLAGNAYRGVGIPFCVRSGEQAAERVAQAL
jgi:oxygen-dependent protoporphyrinogen oxidase